MKTQTKSKRISKPAVAIQPTPGPWRYHHVSGFSGCYSITNDPSSFPGKWQGCIAKTPERDFDTAAEKAESLKQDEANARLIAAAPELLVALQVILHDLRVAYAAAYCGPQTWTAEQKEQFRLAACDADKKAVEAIEKALPHPRSSAQSAVNYPPFPSKLENDAS